MSRIKNPDEDHITLNYRRVKFNNFREWKNKFNLTYKLVIMKKRPGKVALTIPAKKNNYWEIYKYTSKGKPTWGNRLVSPNGKIITGNKDFNRKQIAIDNVNLVKEGC